MKILLLRPDGLENNYLPVGLMSLTAFMRKHGYKDVKLIDNRIEKMPLEDLAVAIDKYAPDVIGISALSVEYRAVHEYAKILKRDSRRVLVVGGPYAFNTELVLSGKNIDYAVMGEGEESFLELLNDLRQLRNGNKVAKDIAGVAYVKDGNIISKGLRDPIDIHSLPWPAYDAVDVEKYFYSKMRNHNALQVSKRYMPVFSSRGCPYRCTYCQNPFGRKFRMRAPEDFVDELEFLSQKYGITDFHIEDDAINVDLTRAKDIFRLILKRGLMAHFAFPSGMRADNIDAEFIRLMKKAGVYRVCYGIESASSRILKQVRKGLDLTKVSAAIDMSVRSGISTHGFFMMGFPDETEDEVKSTIAYALKSKLNTAHFGIVTPFCGTEMYEMLRRDHPEMEQSLKLDSDFKNINVNFSKISDDRLSSLRKEAWLKFYLSPLRVWSIFITSPNKLNLFNKFIHFIKYVFVKDKA